MKKAVAILILLFLAVAVPVCYDWGHHMFVTGLNPFSGAIFFVVLLGVAIILTIFIRKLLVSLAGSTSFFSPALLFGIAAVSFWILGMLGQIYLANSTIDIHLHDTYYVIQRFPSKVIPLVFAAFSIIYFAIEKLTGKQLNRILAYLHFGLTYVIVHLVFLPKIYGFDNGIPRRYLSYEFYRGYIDTLRFENVKTDFTIILLVAQVLFLLNLVITLTKKRQLSI